MLYHRATRETDREQLEAMIAADDDHRGRCKADFWLPKKTEDDSNKTKNGATLCLAFEDDKGVVFFLRLEKILRVHTQFGTDKIRTARALIELNGWLDREARQYGYIQVIWDSVSASLIKFAEKFGYHRSPNEIVKDIR
jgi:hypothetical protein